MCLAVMNDAESSLTSVSASDRHSLTILRTSPSVAESEGSCRTSMKKRSEAASKEEIN
jgi:hypothetical protein